MNIFFSVKKRKNRTTWMLILLHPTSPTFLNFPFYREIYAKHSHPPMKLPVTRSFARQQFGIANPIGKSLTLGRYIVHFDGEKNIYKRYSNLVQSQLLLTIRKRIFSILGYYEDYRTKKYQKLPDSLFTFLSSFRLKLQLQIS